jgi:hypothetical protein
MGTTGGWKEIEIEESNVELEDVDLNEDSQETETKVDTTLDVNDDTDKQIKALKRKERLAKQQASETASVASEIAEQNKQLQAELQKERAKKGSNERDMYKNVAKELESAVSALQDQLEQALSTSDFKKAAELNVKIQKAVVKQQAYEAVAEEEHEEEEEQEVREKPQAQRKQTKQQQLPPQLEDWLDENQWFHRPGVNDDEADKKKTRVAVRISDELLKEGYSAEEDDFYQELSERLEKETKKTVQKTTPNTQPQKGTQGGLVRKDGKLFIKPTTDDVNMAKRLGLYDNPADFKKYMIQKAKGERAGSQYVDID